MQMAAAASNCDGDGADGRLKGKNWDGEDAAASTLVLAVEKLSPGVSTADRAREGRMQMAAAACDGDGDGADGRFKGKNGDGEDAAASTLVLAVEKLSLSSSSTAAPSSCRRKKLLLILDINGLLAHTFFDGQGVKIPASRLPDAVVGRKYVFKRPFCDEFLRFCFDNFDVAIWSSATRRNVVGAVECVMGDLADRLLFVWDQAECTDTGFKTLEKEDKPLFVKQLSKVWGGAGAGGRLPPALRGRFSAANTLLVDDSPYKALLNPPNTAIFPLPYKVDQNIDDASLGPKGELRAFLEGMAGADVDVPSYVGSHSLGQQPITEAHNQWSFYSRVVDRFRTKSRGRSVHN